MSSPARKPASPLRPLRVMRLWLLLIAGSLLQKLIPMNRWGHLLGIPGAVAADTSHPAVSAPTSDEVEELKSRLHQACRLVPWTPTCLAQAFAGQRVLISRDIPGEVIIGLRPEGDSSWPAHAWLVLDGHTVTGGVVGETYFPTTVYRYPKPRTPNRNDS